MMTRSFALLASLALTGCASIIEGTTQPVTFKSVPDAATVVISNRAGERVHSGTTPLTVTLKRGSGYFKSENYAVTVSKPGYFTRNLQIKGSVNGWYVGNILFGGLIGMLIVDPATGAMYSLEPDEVETILNPEAAEAAGLEEEEAALTITSAGAVPDEVLQRARPIETN